ncbi:MAG TPA: DUF4437 domain-containing protein [Actinomycetota bacterium]
MRPHVELIHEDDYIWHGAELPFGDGRARQRNLSLDEEDGSASTSVEFLSAFERPAGRHLADTEWYVLAGEIAVGDTVLGKGGYFHAPKGVAMPKVAAKEGTRILLYRELGDWGFEVNEQTAEWARERDLIVLDTEAMPWDPVDKPGPKPGLMIKMLHRNPETGFYSRLIWAKPGWDDHRLAHHPCYEEAYTVWGSMVYNFGDLTPGTYFFRPAWVKHGHFVSHEPDGCAWLIRSDGDLINYYTTNERVIAEGTPENYDPETQGPVITGLPVRSKSTGEWSGDGR